MWQPGFYDRVLRPDEAAIAVASYIIANPVRAGLCHSADKYPLSGSHIYSMEQLMAAAIDVPAGIRRSRRR